MFRRVRFDLRAIQCDVAEFDQPCCLAQLQNLHAFLQHRRLAKAKRKKKNQRTATSTKFASRAQRYHRAHRSAATSAMPALPKMDRRETAA
jgi:hypothetical protein